MHDIIWQATNVPKQHAVAPPAGVEQAVKGPQRQRNELRLLQLRRGA